MKSKYAHNLGTEELARVLKMRKTREDTRAEADALFGGTAKEMRKADRAKLEKLFVQTPVSVTMAPNLQKESSVKEKIAKIFGESMPDLRHSSVPYEHKVPQFKKYVDTKSKEDPTGHLRAGLTGAGIGAGVGGLMGLATGERGGGTAGLIGGGLVGGGTGLLLSALDKHTINRAKEIAQSGDIHPHLAAEIAAQETHHERMQEMEADRRHGELLDALKSKAEKSGPSSTKHELHFHEREKKPAGKCQNCGAPASGGSSCSYCGANDFSKYSGITPALDGIFKKSSRFTDAMRRYPELMKSAESKVHAPLLRKRTPTTDSQGVPPVQSGLSGGSA